MNTIARFFARLVHRAISFCIVTDWTKSVVKFEMVRRRTKWTNSSKQRPPASPLMHLASGGRYVPGWLNVDLFDADVHVDIAKQPLPFADSSFEAIVCQQLIEHLDIEEEVFPALSEVRRVLKPGCEFWVSCPDIEKMCREYLKDGGKSLYDYVKERDPSSLPTGLPHQFVINRMFYQRGEHKNLFDFALMKWTLEKAGFENIRRVSEADLLARYPDFPARDDEIELLAVCCSKPK